MGVLATDAQLLWAVQAGGTSSDGAQEVKIKDSEHLSLRGYFSGSAKFPMVAMPQNLQSSDSNSTDARSLSASAGWNVFEATYRLSGSLFRFQDAPSLFY